MVRILQLIRSLFLALFSGYFFLLDNISSDSSVEEGETERTPKRPKIDEHSEPLFKGSQVSAMEAHIMFQYALKHHLSAKAFSELLLLLQVLLPTRNSFPKSLNRLKKFFLHGFPNICVTEHFYCQVCHTVCDSATSLECSNELCSSQKFDHFIAVPLGPQLQEMMKGNDVRCKNFVMLLMCFFLQTRPFGFH